MLEAMTYNGELTTKLELTPAEIYQLEIMCAKINRDEFYHNYLKRQIAFKEDQIKKYQKEIRDFKTTLKNSEEEALTAKEERYKRSTRIGANPRSNAKDSGSRTADESGAITLLENSKETFKRKEISGYAKTFVPATQKQLEKEERTRAKAAEKARAKADREAAAKKRKEDAEKKKQEKERAAEEKKAEIERKKAEIERKKAEIERKKAETERKKAEAAELKALRNKNKGISALDKALKNAEREFKLAGEEAANAMAAAADAKNSGSDDDKVAADKAVLAATERLRSAAAAMDAAKAALKDAVAAEKAARAAAKDGEKEASDDTSKMDVDEEETSEADEASRVRMQALSSILEGGAVENADAWAREEGEEVSDGGAGRGAGARQRWPAREEGEEEVQRMARDVEVVLRASGTVRRATTLPHVLATLQGALFPKDLEGVRRERSVVEEGAEDGGVVRSRELAVGATAPSRPRPIPIVRRVMCSTGYEADSIRSIGRRGSCSRLTSSASSSSLCSFGSSRALRRAPNDAPRAASRTCCSSSLASWPAGSLAAPASSTTSVTSSRHSLG
jgi:hypothetical protein